MGGAFLSGLREAIRISYLNMGELENFGVQDFIQVPALHQAAEALIDEQLSDQEEMEYEYGEEEKMKPMKAKKEKKPED